MSIDWGREGVWPSSASCVFLSVYYTHYSYQVTSILLQLHTLAKGEDPQSLTMPCRVLCLHGMGVNAAIFAAQTGLLNGFVLYMIFSPD